MGSLVSSIGSTIGGLLQGRSNKKAAQASADAQVQAAEMAAEEARFRPIGMTTRFGTSTFDVDSEGRVTGAGYTLSPELKAYQDRLLGLSGFGLTQAEQAAAMYSPLQAAGKGLFGLGAKYLAESPEQVERQYMARQQDLLAPSREREFAKLQNNLFQTGRGGLAVGATSARPSGAAGLGAASPEMEAYYNAIAQQDAQLAAQAREAGREQVRFGAGLFGTGSGLLGDYYSGQVSALVPYETYLNQAKTLESLGQQPLSLGINIGSKGQSEAGASALLRGGMSAAQTRQTANSYNPFATALMMGSQNPALGNMTGGGMQGMFSNTALGGSGFGTGLAYGNQDFGLFI